MQFSRRSNSICHSGRLCCDEIPLWNKHRWGDYDLLRNKWLLSQEIEFQIWRISCCMPLWCNLDKFSGGWLLIFKHSGNEPYKLICVTNNRKTIHLQSKTKHFTFLNGNYQNNFHTVHTGMSRCHGNCKCSACVCVQEGRAMSEQEKHWCTTTNKQGPSIGNEVLISPCYAQDRSGAADSAAVSDWPGPEPGAGIDPCSLAAGVGVYPRNPLCFHLGWQVQMSVLDQFCRAGRGGGVPFGQWLQAWYTEFGSWVCSKCALSKSCVRHAAWPFMLFQGIRTGGWTKDRKYSHAIWSLYRKTETVGDSDVRSENNG